MAVPRRISHRHGSSRDAPGNPTRIVDVRKGNNDLRVELAGGRTIRVHPFAYLRVGDLLKIEGYNEVPRKVWKLVEKANGHKRDRVLVWPPYNATEKIDLPPHRLRLRFRQK